MNAQELQVGAFGGIAGRVLRHAMGPGTLVTGLAITLVLAAIIFMMQQFGGEDSAFPVAFLFYSFALGRFALAGLNGEWKGTIFSGNTTIGETLTVSTRFIALSLAWIVPLLIIGWRPGQFGEAVGGMLTGTGGAKALSLSTLVTMLICLSPPIFLIVAVAAGSFGDMFSGAHWTGLFKNRSADLYIVYTIYLGGLAMLALLFMPVFTAIAFQNPDLAAIFGFAVFAYGTGVSVTLLGRLCGFFAAFDTGTDIATANDVTPAPSHAASPTGAPLSEGPSTAGGETVGLKVIEGGKTLLNDVRAQVDAITARFEDGPREALDELEELREKHPPHPLILHTLCLLRHRSGQEGKSMEVAREAIPLCVDRGVRRLAAEVFAVHLDRAGDFKLPATQILGLAEEMRRMGSFTEAERAYRMVLKQDFRERKALKGMLQLAENHLKRKESIGDAQRIYTELLEEFGDSPLANFMREGLAEAERKIASG